MAIYDQAVQAQQRERAAQLLGQGLTTRQISERLGMTQRAVLRVKKKLEDDHVAAQAKHTQITTAP